MTNYENYNNEIINEDTINYLHDIYIRSDTYKKKQDEEFNRKLYSEPQNLIFDVLFRNRDLYENIGNKWEKIRKDYEIKINTLIDINDRNIKGFIKKLGLHLRQNFADIYELIKHRKFIYKNSSIKNRKELYERIFECVKYIFWVVQLSENELVDRSFFDYTRQSFSGELKCNLHNEICGDRTPYQISNYVIQLRVFFNKILKKYKDDNFEVCDYTMKDLNDLFDRVIEYNYNYEEIIYDLSENISQNDYTRINNIIVKSENDYHHHYQKWVNHFGLNYQLGNLNGRIMVQKYYIERLKDWGFTHRPKYLSTNIPIPKDNHWCYYLNTNLIFINTHHQGIIQKIMNYNMEDYEKI